MQETAVARDLLLELKRASWLPPFSATGVREIVEMMGAMYGDSKELQELARSEGLDMRDPECSAAPMVRMLTMIRNRDMLMGYLRHRMERIEEARWDVAGNLPSEALELLSPNEREYDREYAGLLAEFQAEYDDFDLTLNATPPTDLYIKVLVKHEVGEIIGPESGATIDLRAGETIFLRRRDVEPLIRQGSLEHIEG